MTEWVRSSFCDGGSCVEVAFVGKVHPTVGVRNSRDPETVLWFTEDEWAAFTLGVKASELST